MLESGVGVRRDMKKEEQGAKVQTKTVRRMMEMSSRSSLTPLRKRARTVSLQVPANTSMLPSELPIKPLVYETKTLSSAAFR